MFHDGERLSGLASMRRMQTAGELMHFSQFATSLPWLEEAVELL